MDAAAIGIEDLTLPASSPGLRWVIDQLLDGTDRLIVEARNLPPRRRGAGLALRIGDDRRSGRAPVAAAARGDPLATRVKLSKGDFAAALLTGVLRGRRR